MRKSGTTGRPRRKSSQKILSVEEPTSNGSMGYGVDGGVLRVPPVPVVGLYPELEGSTLSLSLPTLETPDHISEESLLELQHALEGELCSLNVRLDVLRHLHGDGVCPLPVPRQILSLPPPPTLTSLSLSLSVGSSKVLTTVTVRREKEDEEDTKGFTFSPPILADSVPMTEKELHAQSMSIPAYAKKYKKQRQFEHFVTAFEPKKIATPATRTFLLNMAEEGNYSNLTLKGFGTSALQRLKAFQEMSEISDGIQIPMEQIPEEDRTQSDSNSTIAVIADRPRLNSTESETRETVIAFPLPPTPPTIDFDEEIKQLQSQLRLTCQENAATNLTLLTLAKHCTEFESKKRDIAKTRSQMEILLKEKQELNLYRRRRESPTNPEREKEVTAQLKTLLDKYQFMKQEADRLENLLFSSKDEVEK